MNNYVGLFGFVMVINVWLKDGGRRITKIKLKTAIFEIIVSHLSC